MSSYQIALLLHLAGVIAYFSGLAVAAAALAGARRRELPSEIAAVLALARTGVALVAIGMVAILACGLWLVSLLPLQFGATWLDASLALFVVSVALGTAGGQAPKRARMLAAQLAGSGNEPSAELQELLRSRSASLLNGLAAAASVAVLVLMVWQPGS